MKVSDLTDHALDWAVAMREGLLCFGYRKIELPNAMSRFAIKCSDGETRVFSPSTSWQEGGPIIERERIEITWHVDHWTAMWWANNTRIKDQQFAHNRRKQGPTPLIAAMRAYVASRMGEEIDVPEGLQ